MPASDYLRQWLERYAALGWCLTPIHEARDDGSCTCGRSTCSDPGKHPRLKGWRIEGDGCSRDIDTLLSWEWGSIGLVCDRSSIFVIDLDAHSPEHVGVLELGKVLSAKGIDLPVTPKSLTGGGGEHLFLQWDETKLGPAPNVNIPDMGVDLRWGGQVLLPPSRHASGLYYTWAPGRSPYEVSLAAPSVELVAALWGIAAHGKARSNGSSNGIDGGLSRALRDGPRVGERDAVFNAHAYGLKKSGIPLEEAVRIQRELWSRCEQPDGNKYEWDTAQAKVRRIYDDDSIEPEGVPGDLAMWAEGAWRANNPDPDSSPDPPAGPLTDVANADRFAALAVNDFVWVPERRKVANGWCVFDSQRWVPDMLERRVARGKRVAGVVRSEAMARMEVGDLAGAQLLSQHAVRCESEARITAALNLARELLACSIESFDTEPWLLNTPGGVVNLHQPGEVARAAKPEDLLTKLTGYAAGDGAGVWEGFLRDVLPDEEVRTYVQEAVGYSLVGVTSEKVIFVVCGPTGTGKTVFVDTLARVLDDYAVTVPTQYVAPSGIAGAEDRLRLFTLLRGARLALCSEPESGARLSVAVVKDLTGGHRVSARSLFEAPVSYVPEATLWLDTNHFPRVEDFDDSIWEKLRVIPFTTVIPEERREPRDELMGRLLQDGGAVLRWALEGLQRWLDGGRRLREPPVVHEARVEEREDQDWLAEFIGETLIRTPEGRVQCSVLYGAYQRWAALRGVAHFWTQTRLTKELKQGRGFVLGKSAGVSVVLGWSMQRDEQNEL